MFKITAICVAGVGTSVFCKELLGQAIDLLGYEKEDFVINTDEISMARGVEADTVVTANTCVPHLKEIMESKNIPLVGVASLCKEPEKMAEGIRPYVEKAYEEGKVRKVGEKPRVGVEPRQTITLGRTSATCWRR